MPREGLSATETQSHAYFFNPRREVLNEQLAQVVEGLEFAGLEENRDGEQVERNTVGG